VRGSNDILYNLFDAGFADPLGLLRRRTLTGDLVEEWQVENFHHMFEQLPDGTVVAQTLEIRPWTDPDTGDTEELIGDTLTEIAPDGTQSVVFNAWDWLDPVETHFWDEVSIFPDGVDWTHGNSIKYDAASDNYLLSFGHAGIILDIDRETGSPGRIFGAYEGEETIPVVDGSNVFDYQHDVSWQPDGHLAMFTHDLDTDWSGGIEYELTDDGLVEVWSHDLDDGDLSALALGQVRRLSNGNTLINYGAAGALREVTPDGEVVWEALPPSPLGFAQVQLFDDWYAPEPL
jgi:hypothetical protein